MSVGWEVQTLSWGLVGLAFLEMLCKTSTLSKDSRNQLDYDMRRVVEK